MFNVASRFSLLRHARLNFEEIRSHPIHLSGRERDHQRELASLSLQVARLLHSRRLDTAIGN